MAVDVECPTSLQAAARAAADAANLKDGHLSVELVDSVTITELNRLHRGKDEPTDVLSFPVDGVGPVAGPREIGDVIICPEHTIDLEQAVVHGVLHLAGFDHETDGGEMLELEARVIAGLRGS